MPSSGYQRLNIVVVLKCRKCKATSGESGTTKSHFRRAHANCSRPRRRRR